MFETVNIIEKFHHGILTITDVDRHWFNTFSILICVQRIGYVSWELRLVVMSYQTVGLKTDTPACGALSDVFLCGIAFHFLVLYIVNC